jgi:hypothetical protein
LLFCWYGVSLSFYLGWPQTTILWSPSPEQIVLQAWAPDQFRFVYFSSVGYTPGKTRKTFFFFPCWGPNSGPCTCQARKTFFKYAFCAHLMALTTSILQY